MPHDGAATGTDCGARSEGVRRPSGAPAHIAALDGVRGIAILFVLLVHGVFFLVPEALPSAIRQAAAPLWIGVNIFFVLSGFLITGILIDTVDRPRYFSSFYMRRVLRIFPLYFGTLALVFGLGPLLHAITPTPLADQFWYWSYLFNWEAARGHGLRSLSHFWSLAVEEQFYIVWPVVVFAARRRSLPIVCLVLIAGSVLFRGAVIGLGYPTQYAYFLTPARLEDLSVGALAAWVARDERWIVLARRSAPAVAAVCVAAFLAAWVLGGGFQTSDWPAVLFGTTGICVLTALTLLVAAKSPRSSTPAAAVTTFLEARTLRFFGRYSYGMYVFHMPIVVIAHGVLIRLLSPLSGSQQLVAACGAIGAMAAVVSAAAWLSYHLFEIRFLRMKDRFGSGPRQTPTVAALTDGTSRRFQPSMN